MKTRSVASLSVLALLLMGVAPVFAGDPGGPGAPNMKSNDPGGVVDAPIAASGTWHDTKLISFSQTTVGSISTIVTEICGTITGTVSGTYCDFRSLNLNVVTLQGTFTSSEFCMCNASSLKRPFVLAAELGTATSLVSIISVQYTWNVEGSVHSTISNGTLNFSGIVNIHGLLGSGTYSGTIN